MRRTEAVAALVLCLAIAPVGATAEPGPLLLTGEVYSRQAQEVIVPLTSSWRAQIIYLAREGGFVEPGTLVAEFDGTEAARAMESQREAARTELARTERDLARLEKELAQAEFQQRRAEVALELARLKAEIPPSLIGAIEHAENQLALEEATKSLDDARKQLEDRRQSLAERERQAALDARKNDLQEQWWAEMLASLRITAQQPGYVIHGVHPWTRAKYQEGDSVRTSFQVAQVADTRDLAVKVWINAVDRPRIVAGKAVRIVLDALPEAEFTGRIERISDSGAKRQEWGDAVYYEGVVLFTHGLAEELLPGMSALIEVPS